MSLFGNWIESEIKQAVDKVTDQKQAERKAEETLLRCLSDPGEGTPEEVEVPKGRYRDPAEFVGRMG